MPGVFALLLSLFMGAALPATPEQDVQRYLAIFKGSDSHERSVEDLAWKGISDRRLYNLIEKRLLAEAPTAAKSSRENKDRVARYLRALGFSGDFKYRATIKRFMNDPVYARYADQAFKDIPYYARWNPVIAERSSWDPKLDDDANRVMNMLHSDDLLLARIGAKRVYFGTTDNAVLELLASRLRECYPRSWDGEEADAVAWMAKALGHADRERYRSLLESATTSPTRGVRNQAASALRQNR